MFPRMDSFSAIVVGSGPAGLAAACLLGQANVSTALVAPLPERGDPRTVALMRPSIELLTTLGLWPDALIGGSAPLRKLRLIDDTGGSLRAPDLAFSAEEIGYDAFGWNIPLTALIPALFDRAVALGVSVIDANATAVSPADNAVILATSSGNLKAGVILAADGQNSRLRDSAGIAVKAWAYDQTAIATSFDHSAGHQDTSTEYHRPAGPFTTVPLPGNRSSLVWLERPDRAAELMQLDDQHLAEEIQLATHGDLGKVSGVGARRAFPMRGHSCLTFARNRVMLLGEAAHLAPPIGAQGLNMSLRDAAHAAELAGDAVAGREDPGAPQVLARYQAARRSDVLPRLAVIDAMNRSLLSEFEIFGLLRSLGLAAIERTTLLRQFVMHAGIKPSGRLPRSMTG